MFSKANLKTAAIAGLVVWTLFRTTTGQKALAATPSVDV